jgi:hypothetical protein
VSDNGADVNYVSEKTGETLLHVLARSVVPDEIRDWAATHIARFELNALDCDKRLILWSLKSEF